MTDTDLIPVFDGHNDTLLRLYQSKEADVEKLFIEGTPGGHIDLPRARKGGFAGGMFAIFLPHIAGALTVCRSAGDVREAVAKGSIAAIFHIEGVEAIDPGLAMLDVLHAAGLRSLGIVWSRPNAFGNGVPFRFPSSPDTGPGLTDAGKALVKACNRLRIMIDLSHLNEKGFRDVAELSDAPLVATHSNVHAICGHSRNLTDWQLGAIRESGGMVGLNFATGFLREDGRMNADTSIDIMVRHIDSLLQALGEDGVGLGSDFDGAMIPAPIGDVAGLPKLIDALAARGFGRALIEKIAYRNWLSVLERTIG
ncbi:MAG: membrane dipeptidase [Mesorhizobium sp.]|nr:MAG: membrane dipeptidase [Mesorhizobium sp.]